MGMPNDQRPTRAPGQAHPSGGQLIPLQDLRSLKQLLGERGVTRVLIKRLSRNDNSKNQVYLAGSFSVLNLIPLGEPRVEQSDIGNQVIHAPVGLSWLTDTLTESPAPQAKLILYPQYPEVRLSGFLRGSPNPPSSLLNEFARIPGRVLFLGIRPDRSVLASIVGPEHPIARELVATGVLAGEDLLVELEVGDESSRPRLLRELGEITIAGWITSTRLDAKGMLHPCRAPNCGGLTLEAQLGIASNSRSEPDYHGWEVKQFGARDFVRFSARSPLTLFTPEPTIGVYADDGVARFIRRFGYADTKGRENRLNVGGKFAVGRRAIRTGLTLTLVGYDAASERITDVAGGLHLVSDDGEVAAGWPFTTLIEHWNRKHAQAAYVPSLKQDEPRAYRYGSRVFLGTGTNFGRFLASLASGAVYYDPGIKLEGVDSLREIPHRRSQFRVSFARLRDLYSTFESIDLRT